MPVDESKLIDGNNTWEYGMDSSRHPADIDRGAYFKGINVFIPRTGGGITNRGGWHYQHIDWSANPSGKSLYEDGHIQGEGWYWDGFSFVLLRMVSGVLIELRKVVEGLFEGRVLDSENDPSRTKAWITRVPFGAIVNDGQSLPIIASSGTSRRADPAAGEIGTGRMGVYLQNRFFYVDPTAKFIQASNFRNPYSITESSITNIHGWLTPQDENDITAIGRQKAMLQTPLGGILSFSDGGNIYSVDVRGSRESWEVLSNNVGKVQQAVPSIGAISGYSFEQFNTNLYFRSQDYGLCDLRQSEFQFVTESDFESQSAEVANWFGNDTPWMLDQCYTRRYKNRLYTTTGGEISHHGYVFWNGLVVSHPRPGVQRDQSEILRRFEGLVTGVRPWCVTVVDQAVRHREMFVDSYDPDEKNRLYKYVDESNYDVNHKGDRIEIESVIETRSYDSRSRNEPKQTHNRFYRIGDLARDINVTIYSRPEGYGQWGKQWDIIHRIQQCCNKDVGESRACFNPKPIKKQERKKVNVSSEAENDPENPDYGGGSAHCTRQYRLEFKGAYRLYDFMTICEATNWDSSIKQQEDEDKITNPYMFIDRGDFGYNVASANNNPFLFDSNHDTDDKPS